MNKHWIWQRAEWPHFVWRASELEAPLREVAALQGRLLGRMEAAGDAIGAQSSLDALLQNIVTSSAIEGEQLDAVSVRSSLARRLAVPMPEAANVTAQTEGLAELMLDATRHHAKPLTQDRLFQWHRWLFPPSDEHTVVDIRVGDLRGAEPMQVVSGRVDRPKVHFVAPPREGLEPELDAFLRWLDDSRHEAGIDPLLRAGLAHLWFVTLHPFDDGNGRLARAITDLALAQAENQAIRFYAMSVAILDQRKDYYRILETTQQGGLDVTEWLRWFLQTLLASLNAALSRIDRVLDKTRFWQLHSSQGLLPPQIKVLNRLLDGGSDGFEHGISASQYQKVAKVSKATATRHLTDLLAKACLVKLPGGGRSTRYHINWPMRLVMPADA